MNDIKFTEEIKKHKHFTKIEENTWLVQSDPQSKCQAYFVTVLPCAIVMYGDYNGVIVKPHEAGKENLIGWMAGATCLSYFAEKVINGNNHHQVKEFSKENTEESVAGLIASRYDLSNRARDVIRDAKKKGYNYQDIEADLIDKIALELNCHPDNVRKDFKEFDKLEKEVEAFLDASFEDLHEFKEFCEEYEYYDYFECNFEEYTHQIKWQHQCLLWWANNVLGRIECEVTDGRNMLPL